MTPQRIFSEGLIVRLSLPDTMDLEVLEGPGPLPITWRPNLLKQRQRSARSSSLGLLDKLPPEILGMVLQPLDFQSLARFARTSHSGQTAVTSLPAYKAVMRHALEALAALKSTSLLKFTSVAMLHHALCSRKCVSCLGFGGFLFLPTCERVCYECLMKNPGLGMIDPLTAKLYVGLTTKQMADIPVLKSPLFQPVNPNNHGSGFGYRPMALRSVSSATPQAPCMVLLVCAKEVKDLALQIHGHAEKLAKFLPSEDDSQGSESHKECQGLHEVPLGVFDPSKPSCRASWDKSINRHYASIRFPAFINGQKDPGRICMGCLQVFGLYKRRKLSSSAVAQLVPDGVDISRRLQAFSNQLHPNEDFLDHIKECYGVRVLLMQWGED